MSDRTLSNFAGWSQCGAYTKDTSPPGPAAQLGTEVHAIVARHLQAPVPTIIASTKAADLAQHALTWLATEVDERRPEVAYAIAPGGGVRKLGENIDREYAEHGAIDVDVCGSADVVGDGVVVDLKTGRQASWEKHEPQMRALGYCVAKVQGRDRVRCVVLHVTAKGCTPHERTLDAMDLAAIGHEIQVARSLPQVPRPGRHCDAAYCGSRATCPAYLQMRGAA